MAGKLYIVSTPIGNLDDITLRALKILETVDYIAAEDTRHSIKLLNHFQIKTKLESYHEHNKFDKADKIVEDLKNGLNVALISDAGTPAISDPGEVLVSRCHQDNIEITGIPGPVALINALVLSGKSTSRFCFEGFLPYQKKLRKSIIEELKNETRTIIVYEAPHKLISTLQELLKALGNRNITIARELTKKFEEIKNMSLEDSVIFYQENDIKGECVLIIEGKSLSQKSEEQARYWDEMTLEEHLELYLKQNISKKEAIKLIAKDRNKPKREIYNYFNQ